MTLPELLALVAEAWPTRFERGRVLHLHRNALPLPDGSVVHLRVLVQTLTTGKDTTDHDASDRL